MMNKITKSFIISVLFLCLVCGSRPVFALSSNHSDHVMGENNEIDINKTYLSSSRAKIESGWFDKDGIKCFKDNYGNLIGEGVKKVIDVSEYNDVIDWQKVSQTDIDGVIIRIVSHKGGYYHIDSQFENNLKGCRKYNIPFGVYIYDYSNNVNDANNEADMIIKYLQKYSISPNELSYPVYFDMERRSLSKSLNEQIADAFVNKLVNAGYNTKIYSYRSMLQNELNSPIILQHVDWVAAYTDTLGFSNPWYSGPKGWQYTNGAVVDGAYGNEGYVDMSVWYDLNTEVSKYFGWKKINNQWYYGNEKGILQIGWEYINNQWYYFNTSGVMLTGWLSYYGNWYYLDQSGAMVTGLQTIGNEVCYFDANGIMQRGWRKAGDKWYYFNASGYAYKGWFKYYGNWYYLDQSGAMVTGLQSIGNELCYFDANGIMQRGWRKVGDKWYYFNASGYAYKGWFKYYGNWYYLDQSGVMVTGLQTIGNEVCYFDANGIMQRGWRKVGDKWYYFNASGYAYKGWFKYYGNWYYMDQSGVMVTGLQTIGNELCYFDANGIMQRGWRKVGDKWYYFNASGYAYKGWFKYYGNWYYLDQSGAMVTESVNINDVVYNFDTNGVWIG